MGNPLRHKWVKLPLLLRPLICLFLSCSLLYVIFISHVYFRLTVLFTRMFTLQTGYINTSLARKVLLSEILRRTFPRYGMKLSQYSSSVKVPNIVHLSLLTTVGYYKKDTNLKNFVQPNKSFVILYLHRVQNGKYFPNL